MQSRSNLAAISLVASGFLAKSCSMGVACSGHGMRGLERGAVGQIHGPDSQAGA